MFVRKWRILSGTCFLHVNLTLGRIWKARQFVLTLAKQLNIGSQMSLAFSLWLVIINFVETEVGSPVAYLVVVKAGT